MLHRVAEIGVQHRLVGQNRLAILQSDAADASGGRGVYVYLWPGDSLRVEVAPGDPKSGSDDKTTADVEVDEEGARRWRVVLRARDHLETGRPKTGPPPP